MGYDECKSLGIEIEENVGLTNATNPNIATLRKSLIPTQLCQLKTNTTYAPSFGIFEVGRAVEGLKEDGMCNEKKKLAVTLFSKTKSTEELYFELRDILTVLSGDIKHAALSFSTIEATHSYEHPKNLNNIYCDGKLIGEIGIVNATVSKKIDKKANIVYAEIDVAEFASIANASIKYEAPSKFPEIEIDLSFFSQTFAPIAKAIEDANCPLVK